MSYSFNHATLTRNITIALASGDRTNTVETSSNNKLVIILDPNTSTKSVNYAYADGQHITSNDLSSPGEKSTTGPEHGWQFSFDNHGEKGIPQTLVFDHKLFVSTCKCS